MDFFRALFLLALVSLSACSFKASSPNAPAPVSATRDGLTNPSDAPFRTDGSQGEFNGVRAFDPNTSLVTVGFTSLVRIVDPQGAPLPIAMQPFEYLVSDTPEWPAGVQGTPGQTDSQGNLQVEGLISYLELSAKPETYVSKYILVRSLRAPYVGNVQVTQIRINPFQRGPLFYRDVLRNGEPAYEPSPDATSRLLLTRYSAYFLQRRFEVNKHLQLTTLREWSFTLKPQLYRPNALGSAEPQPLQPGTRFLLRAIATDPAAEAETSPLASFLSGYERVVEVDANGEIHAPVTFPVDFTAQHRLDSRARVHLTLTPLAQAKELVAPVTLSAPFVFNPNGSDRSEGEQIQDGLSTVHRDIPVQGTQAMQAASGTAHLLKTEWGASPLKNLTKFLEQSGPLHVTLEENNLRSLYPVEPLLSLARNPRWKHAEFRQALVSYCRKLRLTPEENEICERTPSHFFHVTSLTVVDEVLDASPLVDSTDNTFRTLSMSYFNEHQEQERKISADKDAQHYIAGASAKVGYGILGNEATLHSAFNKELEWYTVHEAAIGNSKRSRLSSADTITLSKEEISLNLHLRLRYCVWIQPDRFLPQHSNTGSHLVCSSPQDARTTESWFSIRDRWNSVHSAHSDPKSPQERGWTKLIRGKQAYEAFQHLLNDTTRSYTFRKVDAFMDGVSSLVAPAFYSPAQIGRLNRDGGIFPGVLARQEASPIQWSTAQIEHSVEQYLEGVGTASKANAEALRRGAEFGWCFYETAARLWDHEEFLRGTKSKYAFLKSNGVYARCLAFAGGAP